MSKTTIISVRVSPCLHVFVYSACLRRFYANMKTYIKHEEDDVDVPNNRHITIVVDYRFIFACIANKPVWF